MKGAHVEALEERLRGANHELDLAEGELREAEQAVTTKAPRASEKQLEAAQQRRDACRRRVERARLRVEGIEAERPEAERADAADRCKALQVVHDQLRAEIEAGIAHVEAALEQLARAGDEIEKPSERLQVVRSKLERLAQRHGVEVDVTPARLRIDSIGVSEGGLPREISEHAHRARTVLLAARRCCEVFL